MNLLNEYNIFTNVSLTASWAVSLPVVFPSFFHPSLPSLLLPSTPIPSLPSLSYINSYWGSIAVLVGPWDTKNKRPGTCHQGAYGWQICKQLKYCVIVDKMQVCAKCNGDIVACQWVRNLKDKFKFTCKLTELGMRTHFSKGGNMWEWKSTWVDCLSFVKKSLCDNPNNETTTHHRCSISFKDEFYALIISMSQVPLSHAIWYSFWLTGDHAFLILSLCPRTRNQPTRTKCAVF